MVPDGITGTAGIRNTGEAFIGIMVMDTVGTVVIEDMMPGVGPGGVGIMAGTCGTVVTADIAPATMCGTEAVPDGTTAATCATVVIPEEVMAPTCGVAVIPEEVMAPTCGAAVIPEEVTAPTRDTAAMGDAIPVVTYVAVAPIVVVICTGVIPAAIGICNDAALEVAVHVTAAGVPEAVCVISAVAAAAVAGAVAI